MRAHGLPQQGTAKDFAALPQLAHQLGGLASGLGVPLAEERQRQLLEQAGLTLGSGRLFRDEGQLEIARFGVGAAVWTFSFHVHVDSVDACHIQATIVPGRS